MNVVQVTSARDIAEKAGIGQEQSEAVWDALTQGYRVLGSGVRFVVRPHTPDVLGVVGAIERSDEGVRRIHLDDCLTPARSDGGVVGLDEYDGDCSIDVRDEDGHLFAVPQVVEDVPRTSLTAVVSDTGFQSSKVVSGVDNCPSHLGGRAVKETYPFETRYFAYFTEGMRVFERLDDTLRQTATTPIDDENTIVVGGDEYVPTVVERTFDDGIQTSHYSLCGDDIVTAIGTGAVLPPLACEQVPPDPEHDRLPFNDYEAFYEALEEQRQEQEAAVVEGDESEWDEAFESGGASDSEVADKAGESENPFGNSGDFTPESATEEGTADQDDDEGTDSSDDFDW